MKIERKVLLGVLEPLKAALASSGNQPSYRRVWFDGKFITAHDGGVGMRIAFPSTLKLGVEGTLLMNLLDKLDGDTVQLDHKDTALHLKAGKSNVKLATMSLDDRIWPYPDHDKPNEGWTAKIQITEAFVHALRRVAVVKASKPRRTEHYAVCIFPVAEGKEMDLYTTDSHVLATMPVAEPLETEEFVIALPRALADMITSRSGRGTTLYKYKDHFFTQATERMAFYCNMLDTSSLTDLPGVVIKLHDEPKTPALNVPQGMREALERVCLLTGSEEPVVKLRYADKVLQLSATCARGELDETFKYAADEAPAASLNFVASEFLRAGEVQQMSIAPTNLNLMGKGNFVYILAPHGTQH